MKKKSQIFKNINENEIKKYIILFMKEHFTYYSLKKEYLVNESIFKHLNYTGLLDEDRFGDLLSSSLIHSLNS